MPRRLRRGLAQAAQAMLDRHLAVLKDLVDRVPSDANKVATEGAPQIEVALNDCIILRELMGLSDPEPPEMVWARKVVALPRLSVDDLRKRPEA